MEESKQTPAAEDPTVTDFLRAWNAGSEAGLEELISRVYGPLRRLANRVLLARISDLQPTELVHETYLRLFEQNRTHWHNRGHFFAISGRLMHRIVVDELRARQSLKRGGEQTAVSLDLAAELSHDTSLGVLELDDTLNDLEKISPQQAEIVRLRFFAGLSIEETAVALSCSRPTVVRGWRMAKAWLYHYVTAPESER